MLPSLSSCTGTTALCYRTISVYTQPDLGLWSWDHSINPSPKGEKAQDQKLAAKPLRWEVLVETSV